MNTLKSEALRSRIREWCQRVMDQKDWTPRRWAQEAGVSPTTLTRFMNSHSFHYTLSAATLDKLARAANATLDFHEHHVQQVYIPVFDKDHLEAAIKGRGGDPLNIYSMTSDENIPVSSPFRDCIFIRQDNGKLALCRNAPPVVNERVLAWCPDGSVSICYFRPPFLTKADNAAKACPINDPETYIFGECVGELELFKTSRKSPIG